MVDIQTFARLENGLQSAGVTVRSSEVYQAMFMVLQTGMPFTADDIADFMLAMKPCDCLDQLRCDESKEALVYGLTVLGIASCESVLFIHEFKRFEFRMPTRDELFGFARNVYSMGANAEAYCLDANHPKPAIGLDKLVPRHLDAVETCSVCCEQIGQEQLAIVLPCKHAFHSSECLGDRSVLTWLAQNRKCPNCNSEFCM